jgi:hypothetical protein
VKTTHSSRISAPTDEIVTLRNDLPAFRAERSGGEKIIHLNETEGMAGLQLGKRNCYLRQESQPGKKIKSGCCNRFFARSANQPTIVVTVFETMVKLTRCHREQEKWAGISSPPGIQGEDSS